MLAAFECAADESAANLVRQGDPEAGGGFGREGVVPISTVAWKRLPAWITGRRADGGQLVGRRAVGRGGGSFAGRPATPAERPPEAAEALYELRGPHCRGRGGEPPYRRAHGAMLLREIAINGTERGRTPWRPPMASTAFRAWPHSVRRQGPNILTHCNAGSLATAFTARRSRCLCGCVQEGLSTQVGADETRLVNQARLTAWLARWVPVTLQCTIWRRQRRSRGRWMP